VLVEVVDQNDGVHGVVQERLYVPVAGDAQGCGGLVEALAVAFADRDHLHPGLLREAGQRDTSAHAEHPDANRLGHRSACPLAPWHRPATDPA
jgi:hypothetical protein